MCKHYVFTKPNNQETKVEFCFLFFYVHVKAINEHQNVDFHFSFFNNVVSAAVAEVPSMCFIIQCQLTQ